VVIEGQGPGEKLCLFLTKIENKKKGTRKKGHCLRSNLEKEVSDCLS
jgi:hypothetical protein